jgi:hypothetical protein
LPSGKMLSVCLDRERTCGVQRIDERGGGV